MSTAESDKKFARWIRSLPKDPIALLLKSGTLPVRERLYHDILGDSQSSEYRRIQANLQRSRSLRNLIADQQASGLWKLAMDTRKLEEHQVRTLQFLRQLEALTELQNLHPQKGFAAFERGAEKLPDYLDSEGCFPGRGYHHILALKIGLHAGLARGPAFQSACSKLLHSQEADGSWRADLRESPRNAECLWTTLLAANVLARFRGDKAKKASGRGLHYVREHFMEGERSSLLRGIQAWDHLYTSAQGLGMLQGGTLRVLETAALLNLPADRPLRKLLNWLQAQQLKNGLWPAIVGRDNQGDQNVTLRTLRVFKKYIPELSHTDFDDFEE